MHVTRVFRRLGAWRRFYRQRGQTTGRPERQAVEPKETASQLSEFPGLVVKPGSYPCVVEHPSGQRLPAELDLGAGHGPRGQVFGWPVEERDGIRTLPQPAERYPMLKCDLR